MSLFVITCSGCDGSTSVEMELTLDEFKLIERVCQKVTQTSTCVCMPRMSVEEAEPQPAQMRRVDHD